MSLQSFDGLFNVIPLSLDRVPTDAGNNDTILRIQEQSGGFLWVALLLEHVLPLPWLVSLVDGTRQEVMLTSCSQSVGKLGHEG